MNEDDNDLEKVLEQLDDMSVKDLRLLLIHQELSSSGRGDQLKSRIKKFFGLENKVEVSNEGD